MHNDEKVMWGLKKWVLKVEGLRINIKKIKVLASYNEAFWKVLFNVGPCIKSKK